MSERPDEEAGTDPTEGVEAAPGAPAAPTAPTAPGGAGELSQDAPWWREPRAGAGPWGHGSPLGSEHEAPGWRAGAPGGPGGPGGAGWSQGGWSQGPWGQPGQSGQWSPPGGAWGHGGPWGPGGAWVPYAGFEPVPERPRRSRTWRVAAATLLSALALLVGIGVGYGVFSGATTTTGRSSSNRTAGTARITTGASTGKSSSASGAPSTMSSIAAKVAPDLVDINTVLGYQTEEAAGTGMVLTPTGKVLTNNHVVEGATSISVTDIGNHKTYSATVLGYSRTLDIAVIQLKNASGLKTVSIGNSSTVKVGQSVVGIGNAGGTGGTPSVAGGSVTALNQAITASDSGSLGTTTEHLTGLIQSNAHIQPGDSGGPLVDSSGKVVGMDTAASAAQGFSFHGASTGQGYSIPINTAIAAARQIGSGRQTSTIHVGGTAFLGVYVAATSHRTGSTGFGGFGFRTFTSTTGTTSSTPTTGVPVEQVISGTPASHSGIAKGDVITNVAGTTLSSASDLTKVMLQYHPGDVVRVVWTTPAGQTQIATIGLASGPPD